MIGLYVSMNVINITDENIELLMVNSKEEEKDWMFLNRLWKFVLYSKNISRTLPTCIYCGSKGEFCFEGFGGSKKVGNGVMYIPDAENLYIIPDIVYHYLFVHDMQPTDMFRNMIFSAPEPETEEYIEKIKNVYYEQETLLEYDKKCDYCKKKFSGGIVYKQRKNKPKVKICHPHNLLIGKWDNKYIGLCASCFHFTKL